MPSVSRPRLLAAVLAVLAVLGSVQVAAAKPRPSGSVPNPEVTGPIPREFGIHGRPQTDHTVAMSEYGYVEEEYFFSGTARSTADPSATAPYTTRMIVRRPARAKDFNGTLVVEWNNVSAQHDQTPDWFWSRPMVVREGFAYAIVSAQQAGHCCAPLSLKTADPERYAAMNHPGDAYAEDIYSQAVQALRSPVGVDPMGGLRVAAVLGSGHSQSAMRLTGYVTDVQASANVIDGFLIDADFGAGKSMPEPPVPVINLEEEVGSSPGDPVAQTNYRLWEIAGAAHADYWILRQQFDAPERATPGQQQHDRAWGDAVDEMAGNYGYDVEPRQGTCVVGGNMFPKRYAVSAAMFQLNEWVRSGTPAPRVPRLEFDATGLPARDEYGNVRGGLRLPPIDVPISSYAGPSCGLFGNSVPLDPVRMRQLYPTHADYVAQLETATAAAVERGILLPEDAADLLRRGQASSIPDHGVQSPFPPAS